MEEVQEYKLYVGKFQFISDEIRFSYASSHGRYMLVFDNKQPEGKFTELPSDLLKDLTQEEKDWLLGCKLKINAEFMRKNEEQSFEILDNFLNKFEKELEKEKRKFIKKQKSKE